MGRDKLPAARSGLEKLGMRATILLDRIRIHDTLPSTQFRSLTNCLMRLIAVFALGIASLILTGCQTAPRSVAQGSPGPSVESALGHKEYAGPIKQTTREAWQRELSPLEYGDAPGYGWKW